MNRLVILLCLVFGTATATATARADDPTQLQARTSLNAIGTKLLASHLRHDGTNNALVSSPSLFYALSVLELGAEGASQELLRSRLLADPDAPLTDIAPSLAALLTADNGGGGNGTFQLSNSLWATNGATSGKPFVFAEEFVTAAASFYGAGQRQLDFMAPGASRAINVWAEEQTRGLIPTVADDKMLSTLDWVILNTALFEGGWGTTMKRVGAKDIYRFVALDGSLQAAETIRTVNYVARVVDLDDGSVAFQLPFAGHKYGFIVHMSAPDQDDVRSWLLDAAVPGFAEVAARVYSGEGSLHQLSIQLPVFAFSDAITMRGDSPIAQDLGLTPLFGGRADLSRLSESPSRVQIIKQDTRIELDENGVRAAAATMIGGAGATTVRPSYPRREIVVNRPFAFAIVERDSKAVLFNGVLVSPQ